MSEIHLGDRVKVRNADGSYLSHVVGSRLVETQYTVRGIDPALGVQLADGWCPLNAVERVGAMRPVRAELDPYVTGLRAERAAYAVAMLEHVTNALTPLGMPMTCPLCQTLLIALSREHADQVTGGHGCGRPKCGT